MTDRNKLRIMRMLAAGIARAEDVATLSEAEAIEAKTRYPQVREYAGDVEKVAEQTYRFVISDERVNRYGDVVLQTGWRLSDFTNNPVALWQHGMDAHQGNEPIGAWSEVSVQLAPEPRLVGTLRYASEASPFAARLEKLTAAGVLRAVSPTFMAAKTAKGDEDKRKRYGLDGYGVFIESADLWEVSVVAVGAQPGALRMAAEKGVLSVDEAEEMEKRGLPTEREILARLDSEAQRHAAPADSIDARLERLERALSASTSEQAQTLERLCARLDGALKRLNEREAAKAAPAYLSTLDRLIGRLDK